MSPYKTWADIVKKAKEEPGKLTYATTGHGGTLHLGMERVSGLAGIKMTMVPFKGGTETNAAVLGGHVDLQADFDRLAAAGRRRPAAPADDLDRQAQQALAGCTDAEGARLRFRLRQSFRYRWTEGFGPGCCQKLHDAFKKALADPKVQDIMDKYDFAERYMGSADYTNYVAEIIAGEKAALDKLGLLKKD